MRGRLKIGAWVLSGLAVAGTGSAFGAQGPGTVNYQGVLRDAGGAPRTGSFDMVFRFYDAPTVGNQILEDWHEAGDTGPVAVNTGLFSAVLGGGHVRDGTGPGTYLSLRDVFTRIDQVYLEVTVAGETLSPRTQVLSAAFTVANPAADGPCFDNANRFVDCNNGTVTDTQTGLIWLKNASCLGSADFASANNAASALQLGRCGLTDGSGKGDWRLPTQAEWQGLVKPSCYASAGSPAIPDKVGTGCYATGTQWASGVQSVGNWSSSTNATSPNLAWTAFLHTGVVDANGLKGFGGAVWPVRGGR